MQMKQTHPADNGDGTPVPALEAKSGRWRLVQSGSVLLTNTGTEPGPLDVHLQVYAVP